MTKDTIGFSIVVRTFNSEKTLARLIRRLALQENDEMIVVDSGSTDRTLAIANEFCAKIIQAPGPFNYSKSLNLGFHAAQSAWVLVLSSHAFPMPLDLLSIYREAAAGLPPEIVAAYGRTSVDRRPTLYQATRFGQEDLMLFSKYCGNPNALYRRSAWESFPFDESFRTGEDLAWLTEQSKKGARFALVPAAWILNCHQYSIPYMFKKGYAESATSKSPPMGLRSIFLAYGSTCKSLLFHRMPPGNWLRQTAHITGRIFGSRAHG